MPLVCLSKEFADPDEGRAIKQREKASLRWPLGEYRTGSDVREWTGIVGKVAGQGLAAR